MNDDDTIPTVPDRVVQRAKAAADDAWRLTFDSRLSWALREGWEPEAADLDAIVEAERARGLKHTAWKSLIARARDEAPF